jgi:hypothetical protein
MHANNDEAAVRQTSRRNPIRALVLCAATALFLFQLRHPFFRFTSGAVNDGVGFVMALALPWWAAVEFLRIGRWWGYAIGVLALLPLLAYSGGAFLFLRMDASGGFQ